MQEMNEVDTMQHDKPLETPVEVRESNYERPGERRLSSADEIGRLPRYRRPRDQFTSQEIISALHACKGGMYLAAEMVGCSYQLIYARAKLDPDVMEVVKHYRGTMLDTAESKLREAIERGDAWGVRYALSTIGKKRGYVERVETRNRTQLKGAMVSFLAPPQLSGLLGASPEAISGAEQTADMPQLPAADDKRI